MPAAPALTAAPALITAFALSAALAGCGGGGGSSTPQEGATAAPNGYAAKVAALPERLRAGVMLRAIRDAGQDCQNVVSATAATGATPPAWIVTCDDQRQWIVAIAATGTATVTAARDLSKGRSS